MWGERRPSSPTPPTTLILLAAATYTHDAHYLT
jgi:hypothetical protein